MICNSNNHRKKVMNLRGIGGKVRKTDERGHWREKREGEMMLLYITNFFKKETASLIYALEFSV